MKTVHFEVPSLAAEISFSTNNKGTKPKNINGANGKGGNPRDNNTADAVENPNHLNLLGCFVKKGSNKITIKNQELKEEKKR